MESDQKKLKSEPKFHYGVKIILGGDHAGFELKGKIKLFLEGLGYVVEDKGPFKYEVSDDYPDYVFPVAKEISGKPSTEVRGVIIAGSGQGEIIAANRVSGVRAEVYYGGDLEIVRVSRNHNDSNMFCIGARFVSEEESKTAVKFWLETPFSKDERHIRRLEKIEKMALELKN